MTHSTPGVNLVREKPTILRTLITLDPLWRE